MAIISSTDNSEFLKHRRNPEVQNSKRKANRTNEESPLSLQEGAHDAIDFSQNTLNHLERVGHAFTKILEGHPKLQHHFTDALDTASQNTQQQAITYLSRSQDFLNNPRYLRLASNDQEFQTFFYQIAMLTKEHEKALQSKSNGQEEAISYFHRFRS